MCNQDNFVCGMYVGNEVSFGHGEPVENDAGKEWK